MKLTVLNTLTQMSLALPTVVLMTVGAVIATRLAHKEPVLHIIAGGIGAVVMACGICFGVTNSRNTIWEDMITARYEVQYNERTINPELISDLTMYNVHVNNKSKHIQLSPVSWNHNNIAVLPENEP